MMEEAQSILPISYSLSVEWPELVRCFWWWLPASVMLSVGERESMS